MAESGGVPNRAPSEAAAGFPPLPRPLQPHHTFTLQTSRGAGAATTIRLNDVRLPAPGPNPMLHLTTPREGSEGRSSGDEPLLHEEQGQHARPPTPPPQHLQQSSLPAPQALHPPHRRRGPALQLAGAGLPEHAAALEFQCACLQNACQPLHVAFCKLKKTV